MEKYDARAVANYFLDKAAKEGKPLSPMKLQKLVYLAHGWYLALSKGQPLLDEKIEAWKFGPVVPSLYHALKHFGNQPITGPIEKVYYAFEGPIENAVLSEENIKVEIPKVAGDQNLRAFLDKIWEVYGKFSAIQLSNLTHESGTPWDQVNKEFEGDIPKSQDMSDEIIQEHYQEKLEAQAS